MKIAFFYTQGRIPRLHEVWEGNAASEFFYGAIELQRRGHEIEYYEIKNEPTPSLTQKAIDRLFKWHLLPSRINGSLMIEVYEICRRLKQVDIIVATSTGISLTTASLKAAGIIKPPVIAIFLGLLNYRHSWVRQRVNGLVLRRIWTQLYGEGELSWMRRIFHIPEDRISVNQFGVDLSFWKPGADSEGEYILSVGNDLRRDYDLLLDVAARIDYPFKILTARNINGPIPAHVTVIRGTWPADQSMDGTLRKMYQNSTCVVIPLKEGIQPSGQSVALQAMACGKPVILTRTKGLWSETMIRHGENVYLVPVGDTESLLAAIEKLLADPKERRRIGTNGLKTVLQEGNIFDFADRLEWECQRAIAAEQTK
jgi:glycosyltransferase involved in cell wall biosynthesis